MKKALLVLPLSSLIIVDGCTGVEDPPSGAPPTVTLLSPEPGARVKENLAVAGRATGDLARVSVRLDSTEPVAATGLETWFHLLDVSALPDGSHTVAAIAEDAEGRAAESLPVSFVSTATQPPNTSIFFGQVRNSDQQPLPGATVAVLGAARATVSDLNARYAVVGLPRAQPALLVGSAAGYADTYLPRILAAADTELDVPLFPDAALDYVAGQYGVVRQNGLGTVIGFVLAPFPAAGGHPGTVVSLIGVTGEGPFYTTATGGFDPGLTETTTSGVFAFFNVTPGTVAVAASDGGSAFAMLGSEVAGDALTLLFGRALAP